MDGWIDELLHSLLFCRCKAVNRKQTSSPSKNHTSESNHMSLHFPYKAKALMRFKAQDGQFILGNNQIVTVTGTTDEDGDWLDVMDQEGGSGSVPAGFLVEIEPDADQETQHQQLPIPPAAASIPQAESLDPIKQSNEPVEPIKTLNKHQPAPISAPIQNPPSSDASIQKPNSTSPPNIATPPPASKASNPSASIEPPSAGKTSNPPASIEPPSAGKTSNPPASIEPPSAGKTSNPPASIEPPPTSVQSSTTLSKTPPPPAAKPNALRDRIAMFNKPTAGSSSPPPNIRPKPPIARKPMNIPPPAPPIEAAQNTQTSTLTSHQDEGARSTEQSGMSAADAEESVKAGGSLKDRIRLLQQQQQAVASESPSPTPPKPKREWKRPQPAPTDDLHPILPTQEIPGVDEKLADPDKEAASHSTEVDNATGEATEEDDEVARRQRIAERMAKLGGAKMGFGLPGLMPKPSLPRQSSDGLKPAPEEPPVEESSASALPPERIVMPAIPRRAAPPRRKAPAPSKSPSALETPLVEDHLKSTATADEDRARHLQGDSQPQEQHVEESRPVDDLSAPITETHDNVPLSSDITHPGLPHPERQDVSVQSHEDLASDHLPGRPAQNFEYAPISSEKDLGENDNVPENLQHHGNDESDEFAHVSRQGTSSSIESPIPPQLPHETDRSDGGLAHQQALQHEPLTHPTSDQVRRSLEENRHTSDLPSSVRHDGRHASPNHPPESKSLFEPDESLHDSIRKPVSSAGPPSPAIIDAVKEDMPLEHSRSRAPLTDKASEGRAPSHEINYKADPGMAIYEPDPLPISSDPLSFPSATPASESPVVNKSTHDMDGDYEVDDDAPAPRPLDKPTETQLSAEPLPIQAAAVETPEANTTSGAIDKRVAVGLPTNDEDEEVARRRRIADRLAKMGGRSMMGGSSPHRPLPEPPVAQDIPAPQEEKSEITETHENQPEMPTEDNQSEGLPADNQAEDDDDAARRRRIAERMAKMGGRSMMGGMMPMFSPQQGGGSAANVSKNALPMNKAPSPAQPTRALPPAVHPVKSGSTDSYSAPSPPQRADPMPFIPDPLDRPHESPPPIPPNRPSIPSPAVHPSKSSSTDSYSAPSPPQRVAPIPTILDYTEKSHESPPIPPNRPEGTYPVHSPATGSPHRPRVPNAYSSPKRTSPFSRSADDQLPSSAETHPDTLHYGPPENAEFLSRTPPTRSVPTLPIASPFALGISDESAGPPEFTLRRHGESGYEPEPAFESPRVNEAAADDLESEETMEAFSSAPAQHHQQQQQHNMINSFKARDLDIASERWWRSRPVAPPSSVTSLDDVLIRLQGTSSLNKGVTISQYELIVIRDDYSKTVVNVKFGDNPEDESATELTQSHFPPPEPHDVSTLQALSHSLGPQIVSRAKAKEDEKGFKGVEGPSFVKTIIQSLGNALEPVGSTFGQVIYHCDVIHDAKGSQPEIHIKDDIRPGDIVASYGAAFKGKGIGHNSMTLGSLNTPHAGVVSENDIKKNKFKAFGVFNGKVELLSYRLDELKSGSIVVYRVLDKTFVD
ncbi:hypothetical protein PCASD_07441 [Puccinia coronata f. sp. avenae]|uniref:SH3 domain-containing protein n=1 Tax=Puccinia coronata f. sp. avenae TaxID=200324 RepID=A0A2N5TG93_9BASI|nr:hypothetical protein PCASD_07441 [Puccinia coronata f. sp. avenae]